MSELLKSRKNEVDVLFDVLREHVKNKFDFDVGELDDLKSVSRKGPLVYFRRTMMMILGEAFSESYSQGNIAKVVGLHRTSFIHHSKIHLNDYNIIKSYKEDYDNIRDDYLERIKIKHNQNT